MKNAIARGLGSCQKCACAKSEPSSVSRFLGGKKRSKDIHLLIELSMATGNVDSSSSNEFTCLLPKEDVEGVARTWREDGDC